MAVKTKAPKKPRAKKPKQGYLADMEPPRILVIDEAAEIYHQVKIERVKLSKDEDEAKDSLIDKMKANNLTLYTTADGIIVSITDKSNVKTKKATIGGVDGEFVDDE